MLNQLGIRCEKNGAVFLLTGQRFWTGEETLRSCQKRHKGATLLQISHHSCHPTPIGQPDVFLEEIKTPICDKSPNAHHPILSPSQMSSVSVLETSFSKYV